MLKTEVITWVQVKQNVLQCWFRQIVWRLFNFQYSGKFYKNNHILQLMLKMTANLNQTENHTFPCLARHSPDVLLRYWLRKLVHSPPQLRNGFSIFSRQKSLLHSKTQNTLEISLVNMVAKCLPYSLGLSGQLVWAEENPNILFWVDSWHNLFETRNAVLWRHRWYFPKHFLARRQRYRYYYSRSH